MVAPECLRDLGLEGETLGIVHEDPIHKAFFQEMFGPKGQPSQDIEHVIEESHPPI